MFSISRHLKTLLLTHNCVIVPDLGGFVTQYIPAHFNAETQKFFPPARKVAFNADLTINDGLLVQSLMQTYDATFPEMQKAVEDKVADIKEKLFSVGFYDLPGIGRLSPNLEGQTQFEPADDDIASPTLFGLEFIDAKTVSATESGTTLTRGIVRREGNGYVVHINRYVANAAAAAVCGLFCYFSWTAPKVQEVGIPTEAKLFSTELFASHSEPSQQKDTATVEFTEAQVVTETSKAATEIVQSETAVPETTEAQTSTSAYTIVLAQGLNKAFADQMVESLTKRGMDEGKAVNEGRYYSIHYSGFSTYNEAQAFLNAHRQDADFTQGWVSQLP